MTDERRYRACVGICLLNADNHVFIGRRMDGARAWQMPQGGIDAGEDLYVAARRELREEIGTDKMDIIGQYPDLLRYDLPADMLGRVLKGYVGQEQAWIYSRFTGTDADIDLTADKHPEFSEWKWASPQSVIDLIVPFKKEIYKAVLARFLN